MKWTPRRAAGFLTVGGVAAALLVGPAAIARADAVTPQCADGCIPSVPDGFQVSSATGVATTDGNYDPY
ncbi:hypothetical protein [Streptomyces sp. HD]|uniref:hypothetical protein n=1 Tax=Streptomyces sp. HD TaxID=3020892 RepID=UPI00232E1F9B|nr:hypothetical protein [Streptomyces sp. HD]MDC0768526.1 hypothetical protein [Streptomyces sp. HD]